MLVDKLDQILHSIVLFTHKNMTNEEKEINPDIYIQEINEGATAQEAFEAATEDSEEEED